MLEAAIKNQLREVFAKLDDKVRLVYAGSEHSKQSELVDMVESVAGTSEHIEAVSAGSSDVPRFHIEASGRPVGIAFTGVPGGHEFSSLILAILNANGKGKMPDKGIVARIKGLVGPVRLRTFVSLSCENCPDVVQALNLMASLNADLEHEMVVGEFRTEEAERLGIQGVPAVILGDELVSSGKTNLADLLAKLEERFGPGEKSQTELGDYDIAVIGGGPAGGSAAIYTARKGLKTAIVAETFGGQLQDTKGIENLISVSYTEGPELSAAIGKHVGDYDIDVLEHRRVEAVEPGETINIRMTSGEVLRTKALIIATGAKWRELNIPGEKDYLGRGVGFCPHCDGPYYKGKDIAVIGGGNSGIEAAIDLANIVKSVTVVEFADTLKADKVLVDKLESLANTRVITNAQTTEIVGDGDKVNALVYKDRATGEEQSLELDGVFVQIGLVPNSAFLGTTVKTNQYGEILIDDHGRTNIKGIYAAGDVTNIPYKQIIIAMGEGAKAGLTASEDQMLAS